MAKHCKYHKMNIPPSVFDVVKAQCLDYDRRARMLLDPSLPDTIRESYASLNRVIDDALDKTESRLKAALFRDIQLGRGYPHSPISYLISKNAYYARKWTIVRSIAEGYLLI